MVLRDFRSLTAFDVFRKQLIAVPLVAIALGGAVEKGKAQDLPPTQPGNLAPPSTAAPSIDPTPRPTPSINKEQKEPNNSFTSATGPPAPTLTSQPIEEQDSKIVTLEPKHISAAEFGRVLQGLLLRDDVHIVADERTNRLLIVVSPMTEAEMVRLDKRLQEIKELVDVESPQTEAIQKKFQDVTYWEMLVRDLQLREQELQRQLDAVSQSNRQQSNDQQVEGLKKMEFDVQLARIRRMRSQLDLMEAQLYENAGMQRTTQELPAPNVLYATPPTPPVAPYVPAGQGLSVPGRVPLPSAAPVPTTPALPPAPALQGTGTVPTPPAESNYGIQFGYGDFVPAWGMAGELLRLRKMAPDMDLAPVYEETLQRLEVQLEGVVEQGRAMNAVYKAVSNQVNAGTATAVDVAKIEAQIVPLKTSIKELEVQIKHLKEQRENILQQKPASEPSQVQR